MPGLIGECTWDIGEHIAPAAPYPHNRVPQPNDVNVRAGQSGRRECAFQRGPGSRTSGSTPFTNRPDEPRERVNTPITSFVSVKRTVSSIVVAVTDPTYAA